MSESEASITINAVDEASDTIHEVESSLQDMESSAGGVSGAMSDVTDSATGASSAIDDVGSSMDDTSMGFMDSMNGLNGLSSSLRMGIGDYEQYSLLQLRTQSTTLMVQRAQDAYNKVLQESQKDNQAVASTQATLVDKQIAYNDAVSKYGANSTQAAQAQLALTKAQDAYNKAVDTASQVTQKIAIDQQALQDSQQRLSYYQERSTLNMVMMAAEIPMFVTGIARSAQVLGGLGDTLGSVGPAIAGVGGTVAEFAGGLTLAGVAAGAVVAGVAVAAGAIVVTGISLAMAHQQGETYIQTYSRWAQNIHQTMPGIVGDIAAGAGMVAAGWLQMGQDLQTKAIPALENFAGSAVKNVEGFGSSVGQSFTSMFGSGGTVSSYLTQGVGYLQQLWSNVWSPTGSGAGGFTNMGQMVADAFLGPAGIAFQFPTIFSQLSSKVAPSIGDFAKSLTGLFAGLGTVGGLSSIGTQLTSGITQAITQVTTLFSGLSTKLAPSLTAIQNAFNSAIAPIVGIINALSSGWTGFTSALQVDYSGTLKKLGDSFNTLDGFVTTVVGDVETFLTDVGKVPAEVKATVTVIADAAIASLETIITDLANIVSKTVTVTINEIMNILGLGNAPTAPSSPWGPYPPGKQSGGPINETGVYLLHAGEYVLPPNTSYVGTVPNSGGSNSQQAIVLTNNNILRLDGQVLSRLIQQQMIQRRTMASGYKWG
jgi:hypothetical protein